MAISNNISQRSGKFDSVAGEGTGKPDEMADNKPSAHLRRGFNWRLGQRLFDCCAGPV